MISVVVPVFNGEKHIIKCLTSIVEQTYANIEIVIVNDGSTDHSAALIESYIQKNIMQLSKIKFQFMSQENKGQGVARNKGLSLCTGKYVAFLDQDDYIDRDCLSTLRNLMEIEDAEVVVTGYKRVNASGRVKKKMSLKNTAWSKFCNVTPWGKLYLRKYLVENDIKFLPVVLGEDVYFTLQIYTKSNKIVVSPYIGYYWLDNEKSLSNTVYKSKEADLFPLLTALVRLDNFKNWKNNQLVEYFIFKTVVWFILYTALGSTASRQWELCKKLYSWMNDYFPGYLRNPYIGFFSLKGEKFHLKLIVWFYKCMMISRLDKFLILLMTCRNNGWKK